MSSKILEANTGGVDRFKDKITEKADNLAESVKRGEHKAEDFLHKSTEKIEEKFNDVKDTVSNYVSKNPWKTLGFSVLTGMFLAMLLKR